MLCASTGSRERGQMSEESDLRKQIADDFRATWAEKLGEAKTDQIIEDLLAGDTAYAAWRDAGMRRRFLLYSTLGQLFKV